MEQKKRYRRQKGVYFHLVGGAAGDMLLYSLVKLGCRLSYLKKELAKLNIDFRIKEKFIKGSYHIRAKRLYFEGGRFSSYKDVGRVIRQSGLDKDVKNEALRVYEIIAKAESKIHGMAIEKVHFHHLGDIDAILEICGFFIALKYLKVSKIYVSSFPFGCPSPAALEILKEKKTRILDCEYETVTPTAAALLKDAEQREGDFEYKSYAFAWGEAGPKDYLTACILEDDEERDEVLKVETNIDDMNPQHFEILFEELYKRGALEVFIEQVVMKNSRPGFVLNVLCYDKSLEAVKQAVFSYTSTFGIRYIRYQREKLKYNFVDRQTKLGKVRFRVSLSSVKKEIPEYQDCLRIAKKKKIPLLEVYRKIGV